MHVLTYLHIEVNSFVFQAAQTKWLRSQEDVSANHGSSTLPSTHLHAFTRTLPRSRQIVHVVFNGATKQITATNGLCQPTRNEDEFRSGSPVNR